MGMKLMKRVGEKASRIGEEEDAACAVG